jgi:thiamine kinase-like enzyme
MVDASERLRGFDPPTVFSLCQEFVGGDWTSASFQDFDFQVLEQGFGNRLFLCQIKKKGNDLKSSPNKVLVRFYGGNVLPRKNPIRSLNETTEVLLFQMLGMKGLGPQLFGCFEGGRIEEFIPSKNLSVKQFVCDSDINDSIARLIARYHCLTCVPIKKTPWNISLILRPALDSYLNQKDNILKNVVPPEFYSTAPNFYDFELIREITWVESVLPFVKSRVVFTHNDSNRSNILLREQVIKSVYDSRCQNEITENGRSQQTSKERAYDDRLVLIDYEFSGYNYRGIDLGNHFGMKVFDFGSSCFITGYPYPSQDFRQRFISCYLNQVKQCNEESGMSVFSDWDDDGLDSVDHVTMETEFGAIVRRLTNICGTLSALNNWLKICHSRSKIDPAFKNGLIFKHFVDFYYERKAEFLRSWPQFAVTEQ